MFILRKINRNGLEENFALGDSYSLILKDTNPKHFEDVLPINGHDRFKDEIYGFIAYDVKYLMLFTEDHNYIMTENGKTFKNITNPYRAEKSKRFNSAKPEDVTNRTNLSEYFTTSICKALKNSLNIDTVEQANQYSDEDLLKVPMFGLIALRKLRKLKEPKVSRSIPDSDGGF